VRPMLRPGLHILRRDLRTLQLGLEWPGIACLADSPALRTVLDCVDGFRDVDGVLLAARERGVDSAAAEEALDLLVECGVLVDQAAAVTDDEDEARQAALWLLAGPGGRGSDIHQARNSCRVHVDGSGRVADAVRQLLTHGRIRCTDAVRDADLVIVADDREPDRSRSDQVMHEGLPHLWVLVRDLVGVVGPFVQPGSSCCLRCVDAARADLDPAWRTLLEAMTVRPLRVTACDPALANLVASLAVHEVTVYAGGHRPQTWGAIVEVPQGFGHLQRQVFEPHPHCGCGWQAWHDTMGA
jgi:bacteriocin biosynthesis cyclodehydratase domain-containing protein